MLFAKGKNRLNTTDIRTLSGGTYHSCKTVSTIFIFIYVIIVEHTIGIKLVFFRYGILVEQRKTG